MKKDNDLAGMLVGCFGLITGGALLIGLLTLLNIFLNAWALTTLWGWIAVPTFHMQELLYWQAYGIVVIAGFLTSHSVTAGQLQRDIDTKVATGTSIMYYLIQVFSPVLSVFFTWLVLHFLFAVI